MSENQKLTRDLIRNLNENGLKIRATPVRGKDLKAGDLFSTVGPEYWDNFRERGGIGEKAYIRTDVPATQADDADMLVFRLEILKGGGDVKN